MTTYLVTERGPIDRHAPGTDVSKLYNAATLARLIKEGYVMAVEPPKSTPKKKGPNDRT